MSRGKVELEILSGTYDRASESLRKAHLQAILSLSLSLSILPSPPPCSPDLTCLVYWLPSLSSLLSLPPSSPHPTPPRHPHAPLPNPLDSMGVRNFPPVLSLFTVIGLRLPIWQKEEEKLPDFSLYGFNREREREKRKFGCFCIKGREKIFGNPYEISIIEASSLLSFPSSFITFRRTQPPTVVCKSGSSVGI